jgi:hypothetical protein
MKIIDLLNKIAKRWESAKTNYSMWLWIQMGYKTKLL